MVLIVCWGQHFALINKVNAQRLENLRFHEVSDAHFGHNRNTHGFLNGNNELRVAHARYPSLLANVSRDAFKCHHGDSPRRLRNERMLSVYDIHNYSALEHLG